MVFLLALNIGNDLLELRNTHTECAILNLPLEELVFRESVVHPFRRTTLNELQCRRDRESRRQGQQYMNVVGHAPNRDCFHFMLAGDSSEEWPKSFAQGR